MRSLGYRWATGNLQSASEQLQRALSESDGKLTADQKASLLACKATIDAIVNERLK